MINTFTFKLLMNLYDLLWVFILPFLKLSKRLNEGYRERILKDRILPKSDIWMHAASAGESYLAREIIKNISPHESRNILITTNTSQGKEILEKPYENIIHKIHITYIPFDKPSIIRKALQTADPDLLVLIESEIWPGLIYEFKKKGKKFIIVNGRMTEKSFNQYMKVPTFWGFIKPDKILAISEDDRNRFSLMFNQPGAHHVSNIKFDRMQEIDFNSEPHHKHKFLVLASIRREEETQVTDIIESILQKMPEVSIGLFPRHMHRIEAWKKHLSERDLDWVLRSGMIDQDKTGMMNRDKLGSVILWDRFGELEGAYKKADAAFVGGSLVPLGGQNFIEAFSNGVVPVIGPHYSDFKWVGNAPFKKGLVISATDWKDTVDKLIHLINNPVDRNVLQKKVTEYIENNRGGAIETCRHIENLLEKESNHL